MKKILTLALASLLLIPAAGAQQKINKKNLVIKEWNTDPKGGNKTLDHVTTYSADGKKTEEIEYNSDGKVSRELVYDGHNRLQTYKTFEYNEFLRKKVQYTYNAKGKLLSVKHFEYLAQDAGE